MRRAQNKRKGSLLVETASILLVFLTVLIGTFDVAQVLFLHTSLTERVRGAARYGGVNAFDQTAIQNMVLYNQPTEPSGGSPSFELRRSMVAVTRYNANTPEDRVVVSVSGYPVHYFTPVIAALSSGLTISACASYEPTQ